MRKNQVGTFISYTSYTQITISLTSYVNKICALQGMLRLTNSVFYSVNWFCVLRLTMNYVRWSCCLCICSLRHVTMHVVSWHPLLTNLSSLKSFSQIPSKMTLFLIFFSEYTGAIITGDEKQWIVNKNFICMQKDVLLLFYHGKPDYKNYLVI